MLERPVQLGPQALDCDLYDVGIAVEVDVPDHLGNRRFREDFTLAPGQYAEQRKLFGGQVQAASGAAGLAADQVDPQVIDRHLHWLMAAAASGQGLQPGDQFQKRKRLAQIIISAFAQAAHPVFNPLACGQHDHRCLLARTQGAQHTKAVEFREHHVEHNHRVIAFQRQVQPLDAIACDIHRVALLCQPAMQVVSGFFFVFNN